MLAPRDSEGAGLKILALPGRVSPRLLVGAGAWWWGGGGSGDRMVKSGRFALDASGGRGAQDARLAAAQRGDESQHGVQPMGRAAWGETCKLFVAASLYTLAILLALQFRSDLPDKHEACALLLFGAGRLFEIHVGGADVLRMLLCGLGLGLLFPLKPFLSGLCRSVRAVGGDTWGEPERGPFLEIRRQSAAPSSDVDENWLLRRLRGSESRRFCWACPK